MARLSGTLFNPFIYSYIKQTAISNWMSEINGTKICFKPVASVFIHAYIHTYIHTYIFIRGFALARGTFLLVIFAWICCDGFESQLRNGYLLKCDCLFDCNWHIGTIKWETKIDILGWRDRGSNSRPLASRAGALSITLRLIQLIRRFHKNFI